MIFKILGMFLICLAFSVFVLMCIDKEVARREYVYGIYPIDDCLFAFNCEHYNKLAEKDDNVE